jgi:hypothetical protein
LQKPLAWRDEIEYRRDISKGEKESIMGTKVDHRTVSDEALDAINRVNSARISGGRFDRIDNAIDAKGEQNRRRGGGDRERTREENFRDNCGTFRRRT